MRVEAPTDADRETGPQARRSLRLWRYYWRESSLRVRRAPIPPFLRRHGATLATVLLAFGGAWLALAVMGTTQGLVGPLVVDASVQPSLKGESVVRVDPIGTLAVDSHSAPVSLHVSVRAVDEVGVQDYVDNPSSLTDLDERLVSDLRGLIVAAGVRAAVVAVLGAAIGVALVMRSVRRTLLAVAVAIAGVGGSYGMAAATFDSDAISTPTYTGLLEAAPGLVDNAEFIATNFDAYADQLAGLVTNIATVYNTTLSLPTFTANDDAVRVLHVSDLHLNPAAWDVIDAVADQYEVDVIVDSGDIADHGTPLENNYVQPISTLDQPYVYVKGNHDSVATAAAVAANPNAIVLDEEPVEVAGIRFLGAPDPRFTPDQETRGTADEDIVAGTEEFAEVAHDLRPPADVIVYHDPSHAEFLDGAAPLVLSGHMHRRNTYVLDEGTRVMVQGSTGGAGLRGLQGEGPTPVNLSVLYFDPDSDELIAWDDITLGGLGLTTAQIERHQAGENTDDEGPFPIDPAPTTPVPTTTTSPPATSTSRPGSSPTGNTNDGAG